jgi:hypothetical protein
VKSKAKRNLDTATKKKEELAVFTLYLSEEYIKSIEGP